MKYLLIFFIVAITLVSCSKGSPDGTSPCHDIIPTDQDNSQS